MIARMGLLHQPRPDVVADPLGIALVDYLHSPGQQEVSLIMSNGVPPVTQPVADFFAREPANEIEAAMLAACRGTVLDIAAGAGRSTLLLQHRGLDVLALDISRGAAAVMAARGVKRVQCVDWVAFCETSEEMFDTILMLGRGISLFGSPDRIGRLLSVVARLVAPGGQVVADGREPPAEGGLFGSSTRLTEASQSLQPGVLRFRQREAWIRYGEVDSARFYLLDLALDTLREIAEHGGWRVMRLHQQADAYAVSLQRTW